jgi:pimeloyl-ACP methyl ester carboxylesterase
LVAARYKAWLLQVADNVAEASKEGGFLGFGGVDVSDAEKAARTGSLLGVAALAARRIGGACQPAGRTSRGDYLPKGRFITVVNIERQSQRLHAALPGSRLDVLDGAGHMIHHLDPARIVRAIDLIATGGITRASVRAEAPTWGTPA